MTTERTKLRIAAGPGKRAKIEVDGVDISNIATAARISIGPDSVPMVSVDLLPDSYEIEADLFELIRPHIVKRTKEVSDDDES